MDEPISNALFEGLFCVALDVQGPLEAELRALGYDRRAARPRYPARVLTACIEAARARLHAGVPPEQGQRELGRAFARGLRQTILGRIVTAALPILGPARFLPHLPGRFRALREDVTVVVELTEPTARVTFTDAEPLGGFFAGVLEGALVFAQARSPRVDVAPRADGYVLSVRWG